MKNESMLLLKILFSLFSFIIFSSSLFSQTNRLWASYYGSTGNEGGVCVATDVSSNVYMAGWTDGVAGLASGGFQNSCGGTNDGYLVKFDAAGNRLWATYYGGTGYDEAYSVATDAAGNVYLAGVTPSTSNIASGGFQNTQGGGGWLDAFLVKFDASGNRLWATYYGGSGSDQAYSVAADAFGNVYLAGYSNSASGIASGGFQNAFGGGVMNGDAFLAKFDANGNRLWATYYGGSGEEQGFAVATDGAGNVFLSGQTQSASNIASGGFQNTYGGGGTWGDQFLVKFDANGNRLWATYYGGAGDEGVGSVATDAAGNVFLAGWTTSASNIASGGFQNTFGGGAGDAFLVKFSGAGTRIWSTYYGGNQQEVLFWDELSTDAGGNVFLSGQTQSVSNISSAGFQMNLVGQNNKFLVKFDPAGNRLCATYYGQAYEINGGNATDNAGNVYLVSQGQSVTGLASGGFQNTSAGGTDAFLVKFSSCFNNTISVLASSTNPACNGQCNGTATATASNGTAPYTYNWNTTPVQTTQTATGLCAGTYSVLISDAVASTNTAFVIITQPVAITSTASSTSTSCSGNTGIASLNAVGGAAPYTYLWSNGQTGSAATALAAGNYSATITDGNGCTQTATVTIASSSGPTISISQVDESCIGAGNGLATANVSGGNAPYTYLWNPASSTSSTISALSAGTYSILITDANGCTQISAVTISSGSGPAASAGTDVTIQAGNSAVLNSSGGGAYSWSPSTDLSDSTIANPTASPAITTIYCVIVTDSGGCTDTACVTIFVVPEPIPCGEFYLPNAFSPNGDEENDEYGAFIHPDCVKEYKLVIYNRWGNSVFESEDVTNTWNGEYGGQSANAAVYAYYLYAVLTNGKVIDQKGNVSLVK